MLPFEPEPIEMLRLRYPLAMKTIFDVDAICKGRILRPGEVRAQVFDCEDGVRLIVSREKMGGRPVYLHLSASPSEGSPLWERARSGEIGPFEFIPLAAARYREISGDDRPLEYHGLSPAKRIPHWYRKEREVSLA